MRKILKECLWDVLYTQITGIVGFISLMWAIVLSVLPALDDNVPRGFWSDTRIWYGVAFVVLVWLLAKTLRVANYYRALAEDKPQLWVLYNDKSMPSCHETTDRDLEIVRVGLSVVGKESVDNIELYPSLYDGKHKGIIIPRQPLRPQFEGTLSRAINPHPTPTVFVDVFTHQKGSSAIQFCYDSFEGNHIQLKEGVYTLSLNASGRNGAKGHSSLRISLNNHNEIEVSQQWTE